jgi:hypothetical protein
MRRLAFFAPLHLKASFRFVYKKSPAKIHGFNNFGGERGITRPKTRDPQNEDP